MVEPGCLEYWFCEKLHIPVKSATLLERNDTSIFTFTFLSSMVSRNWNCFLFKRDFTKTFAECPGDEYLCRCLGGEVIMGLPGTTTAGIGEWLTSVSPGSRYGCRLPAASSRKPGHMQKAIIPGSWSRGKQWLWRSSILIRMEAGQVIGIARDISKKYGEDMLPHIQIETVSLDLSLFIDRLWKENVMSLGDYLP